jgi:hypothetical protein
MSTPEESKTLSAEDARRYVGNKVDFYNAMLLNDYFMMTPKSSGCTREYMEQVRAGKYWVPRFTTMKVRGCPYAPTKEHFYREVMLLINEKKLELGVKSHQACDAYFLQVCLSTLNSSHKYFAKNYNPKVSESKHARPAATVVDNSDGFFTGLPAKVSKTNPRTSSQKDSSPTTTSSGFGHGIGSGSSYKMGSPGSY